MTTSDPTIFISYAHKDDAVVLKIIDAMQQAGFSIWYDKGIEAGTEWPEFIAENLIRCECFIAFLSKNYIESHNCRREVNLAIKKKKEILVAYLEDVELTPGMEMQLDILQAIFRKNASSEEEFISEICKTRMLQCCRGASVVEEKSVSDSASQTNQSASPVYVENMTGKDGDFEYTYTGYTLNGKRNGKGRVVWSDGEVYDGEWQDDKRNGKGKYTYASGAVYEGEFQNDIIHGRGKYVWPNGAVHEGEYRDGKRHGRGKYTFANGAVYEGEYRDDKRHGRGKLIRRNGTYENQYYINGVKQYINSEKQ